MLAHALVEIADDDDDGAPRNLDAVGCITHRFADLGTATELSSHQDFNRLLHAPGQVHHLGVEGDQVCPDARQSPQAGSGDRRMDYRADHAAALVDEEEDLPGLYRAARVDVKHRMFDHQPASRHV